MAVSAPEAYASAETIGSSEVSIEREDEFVDPTAADEPAPGAMEPSADAQTTEAVLQDGQILLKLDSSDGQAQLVPAAEIIGGAEEEWDLAADVITAGGLFIMPIPELNEDGRLAYMHIALESDGETDRLVYRLELQEPTKNDTRSTPFRIENGEYQYLQPNAHGEDEWQPYADTLLTDEEQAAFETMLANGENSFLVPNPEADTATERGFHQRTFDETTGEITFEPVLIPNDLSTEQLDDGPLDEFEPATENGFGPADIIDFAEGFADEDDGGEEALESPPPVATTPPPAPETLSAVTPVLARPAATETAPPPAEPPVIPSTELPPEPPDKPATAAPAELFAVFEPAPTTASASPAVSAANASSIPELFWHSPIVTEFPASKPPTAPEIRAADPAPPSETPAATEALTVTAPLAELRAEPSSRPLFELTAAALIDQTPTPDMQPPPQPNPDQPSPDLPRGSGQTEPSAPAPARRSSGAEPRITPAILEIVTGPEIAKATADKRDSHEPIQARQSETAPALAPKIEQTITTPPTTEAITETTPDRSETAPRPTAELPEVAETPEAATAPEVIAAMPELTETSAGTTETAPITTDETVEEPVIKTTVLAAPTRPETTHAETTHAEAIHTEPAPAQPVHAQPAPPLEAAPRPAAPETPATIPNEPSAEAVVITQPEVSHWQTEKAGHEIPQPATAIPYESDDSHDSKEAPAPLEQVITTPPAVAVEIQAPGTSRTFEPVRRHATKRIPKPRAERPIARLYDTVSLTAPVEATVEAVAAADKRREIPSQNIPPRNIQAPAREEVAILDEPRLEAASPHQPIEQPTAPARTAPTPAHQAAAPARTAAPISDWLTDFAPAAAIEPATTIHTHARQAAPNRVETDAGLNPSRSSAPAISPANDGIVITVNFENRTNRPARRRPAKPLTTRTAA